MHFDQAFRLSSLMLSVTAISGLLLARSIPDWLAALAAIVLLLAGFETIGRPIPLRMPASPAASSFLQNFVLIGALAFSILDAVIISQDVLLTGIHFLVLLLCIKLLTLRHRRDYLHLYAVCLMAVLASAARTTDVWYVPVFLLYLVTATWTLLLYHLTGEVSGSDNTPQPQADQFASQRITSRFFWLMNGIAVIAFVLTLVIFFVIPRFSAGILQKARGENLKTTGFSERVDLGMIGSVKEDPQIVMRVELPDQPDALKDRLYLRGVAFDHYDGRSWSGSTRYRRNLDLVGERTYAMRSSGSRVPTSHLPPLRQDILLEAVDTSVLFASPFPEYISGDFAGVQTDTMTGLHLPYPPVARHRYSVTSREIRVIADDQTASNLEYSDAIRNRYIQLPELSSQVPDLARRVTADARTPYDKMQAVYRHLLNGYRYSLDIETTSSATPIDDFLFTRKTGYCEHYATAMVIMLRSIGIPSRLVTGFLATEWNDFGKYYTVRQRDAHAWVEVYFPHSGWVTMDPTPLSEGQSPASGLEIFQRIGESFRLHWDRFFVQYSARDQLALISSLRDGSDVARDRVRQWKLDLNAAATRLFIRLDLQGSWAGRVALGVAVILPVVCLLLLIVLVRRFWPAIGLNRTVGPAQQQIVNLYKKIITMTTRQGIKVHPSTTPLEFVRLVSQHWTAGGAIVADFTELYCRGRFSGSALSREDLARAEEQVKALQRLSRNQGYPLTGN